MCRPPIALPVPFGDANLLIQAEDGILENRSPLTRRTPPARAHSENRKALGEDPEALSFHPFTVRRCPGHPEQSGGSRPSSKTALPTSAPPTATASGSGSRSTAQAQRALLATVLSFSLALLLSHTPPSPPLSFGFALAPALSVALASAQVDKPRPTRAFSSVPAHPVQPYALLAELGHHHRERHLLAAVGSRSGLWSSASSHRGTAPTPACTDTRFTLDDGEIVHLLGEGARAVVAMAEWSDGTAVGKTTETGHQEKVSGP
ncbi:hypothetical protein C8R45DRAFT_1109904 [Mycena sanguinolenta]|nr:hypothetical protein C8R45DRAFT_1109904 [Mycena sanguinolenta]